MPYVDINASTSADVHWDVPNTVLNNTDATIAAGQTNNDDLTYAFLKFSSGWTSIPAGANITSATLYIYCYGKEGDVSDTTTYHRVRKVLESWSSGTVTFNNKPDVSSVVEDNFYTYPGSWRTASVTNWAELAFSNSSYRSYGLRISNSPDHNNNYPNVLLYYSHTASNAPYVRVHYDLPPPPTVTSVAPNAAKSAISVSGGGVDSNTNSVIVYSSNDNTNFSSFGTATKGTSTWSITDSTKAPAPGTPNISLATINGDDIKITWTSVGQSSITRYYKAYENLTSGDNTNWSNSMGTTLTPTISRYTVERMLTGQTTWTKLADIAGTGATLEYTDTTLPLSTTAQYRVYAVNSQGTTSSTSASSTSVNPPPAPVFSTLDVVDGSTFRLAGSGAVVAGGTGNFTAELEAIHDTTSAENRSTYAGLIDSGYTFDDTNTVLEASNNYEGTTIGYVLRNIHMKWDTSSIPDDATITSVDLKIRTGDYNSNDNREVIFQWYPPAANVDFFHKKAAVVDSTTADTLGLVAGIDMGDEEKDIVIPLINFASYINKNGQTGMRAVISGASPSGYNWFKMYSREHATYQGPTLSIKYTSSSVSSSSVNVYASTDGSLYSLNKRLTSPASSNWTTDIPTGNLLPPKPAAIDIDTIIERSITLNWANPGNDSSKRWFKVSNTVNSIESAMTASRDVTITPLVGRFVLERKVEGQSDTYFTVKYDGSATGYTDTNVVFGEKYVYRLTAYNSLGQASTPTLKTATAAPPDPPLMLTPKVLDNLNGSQFVRLAGKVVELATSIQIFRSTDNVSWSYIKDATYGSPPGGVGDEEWWGDDTTLVVSPPTTAVWALGSLPVDTDGIHLKWTPPSNSSSTFFYRAVRRFNTVTSNPSETRTAVINPSIQRYDIQRREQPTPGVALTPENNWKTIKTISATADNPVPVNEYDDNDIAFGKVYDYRIITFNNFGTSSQASTVKSLSTFDVPPPPPPAPPALGATIGNGRPTGTVDITSDGLLRIAWDYNHPLNEPPVSYTLRADYEDEDGNDQTRWWNGSSWSTNSTSSVNSSDNFADISPSIFISGRRVDLYLQVTSANGGRSNIYGQ